MPLNFNHNCIFINNTWQPCASGKTLDLINPSTGEKITCVARGKGDDIDKAVQSARQSLSREWGTTTAVERGRILIKMAEITLQHAEELAQLECNDVGKPYTQAKNDAIAMARYFEFYGGACDKVHGQTIPFENGFTTYTVREPHGVTGHIIPWNYPMQIIGRSVGAALAMGNAVVLKPAEEACLTALALGEIVKSAGLPDGALSIVTGLGAEAGAALSQHPGIDHLSFTGSKPVGTLVQQAGAENVVPVTLELGGKSPQIVFDDADLEQALPFLVNGGIQNAGQTCSASSRILVQQKIYGEVVAKMIKQYKKLKVGPADQDLNIGPLINHQQRDMVQSFLDLAEQDGLSPIAQGQFVDDLPPGGAYVLPTLYGDVAPQHPLAQREIFGPVQVIMPFVDEAQAIELANGTDYGLVAGVWTRDGGRQMRMAKQLQAGQVFINNYGAAGGVELPFGGVKASGHGREKGFEALYGFSTTKTVAIKH